MSTKFLCMHTDNHMNWKNHVEEILPKLSAACFLIRNLIHTLKPETLHMVYFAYFHSLLQYAIIFWGNSTHVHQVFQLQKRLVRVMSGVGPRSSCRGLFGKLNILPIACHYILSLNAVHRRQTFSQMYVHTVWRQKQEPFIFTYCKFILCSKRSVNLWAQNL